MRRIGGLVAVAAFLLVAGCSSGGSTSGGSAPGGSAPGGSTSGSSSAPSSTASASAGKLTIAKPDLSLDVACSDELAAGELVSVPVGGGTSIDGAVIGTGPRVVVFANMYQSHLCDWLSLARELAAKGYRAALIEYSGQGPAQDVVAVVEALRENGAENVFLVGGSMGAAAVIEAAAQLTPHPAAVVSLSPPLSFGGANAEKAVAEYCGPTFFAVADGDGSFPKSTSALHKACASTDKEYLLADGSAHGALLLGYPEVPAKVTAFLDAH